jgi:hypothetical protein
VEAVSGGRRAFVIVLRVCVCVVAAGRCRGRYRGAIHLLLNERRGGVSDREEVTRTRSEQLTELGRAMYERELTCAVRGKPSIHI